MGDAVMRGLVLLLIAGARAAPELVVEVEVNGKMQELRASPEDDPRRAAHAFCLKHNLTVSVENMACGEMLAEELVEKGARYPLPSESLLRVRGGVVPAGPWRDRAQQLVPPMMDPVLGDYARNVPDARDAEVLSLYAAIINKVEGAMIDEVPKIFEAVFECTLTMITANFEDYPDHRLKFFALLRAITNHCFRALFALAPCD